MPRVQIAVAVENVKVRLMLEKLRSLEHEGELPKGQKPRHIGNVDLSAVMLGLQHLAGTAVYHHNAADSVFLAVLLPICKVHPGDGAQPLKVEAVLCGYPVFKLVLYRRVLFFVHIIRLRFALCLSQFVCVLLDIRREMLSPALAGVQQYISRSGVEFYPQMKSIKVL